MTSFEFEIDISAKELAGGGFVLEAGQHLAATFIEQCRTSGLTKKGIADRLGIDKSTVSKMLRGNANMTLETVGELCWAMGKKAHLTCIPFIDEPRFAILTFSSAATAKVGNSPLITANSARPYIAVAAK